VYRKLINENEEGLKEPFVGLWSKELHPKEVKRDVQVSH